MIEAARRLLMAVMLAAVGRLADAQSVVSRSILVRAASGVPRTVLVRVRAPDGEYVRAEPLANALGGTLAASTERPARFRLRIAGVAFDFTAEAAYVRVGGATLPLVAAPQADAEQLWIPVHFVTDVLPRAATGVQFDAEARELRVAPSVASAPPHRAAPVDSPVHAAPVPAERPAPRFPVTGPTTGSLSTPAHARATRIVVVDAGHGGPDSGMHGPLGGAGAALEEKDVTLGIARALRDALQARGVAVVMTRTRDTLIALADRGRIANRQRGDLFVSIHVNAANPAWRDAAGTRGFETYFLADANSEDARRIAELENESVRFEGGAGPQADRDPLGFILSDMSQNEHLRESGRFATLVQRSLAGVHPGPSRGVKQAGFKVLVTASMPAVLVEVGYGTNAADAAFMTSERGQRALAGAVADAAVQYLERSAKAGSRPDIVP